MQLDLNDPASFTLDGVRRLIASADDSVPRQLRVTQDGIVLITNYVGAVKMEGYVIRFETWDENNGNSGLEASKDEGRMKRIYDTLKNNWPNPKKRSFDM